MHLRTAACVAFLSTGCAAPSAPPSLRRPTAPPAPVPSASASPETLIERALAFDLPEPELAGGKEDTLWATYYYVPRVSHAEEGFALRDMADVSLGAKLSRRDWCEAAMQGTVLIQLGEAQSSSPPLTINYAGTRKNIEVDCTPVYPRHPAIGRTRYALATGPYGDGVRGMVLIPHRSIAVDPETIPFGSLVYIPAARGAQLTLPDGSAAIHDGYFFAADRGGAIRGTHIDVFVGIGKHNPFAFVRSKSKETFTAHIIERERAPSSHDRLRTAHEAFLERGGQPAQR